MAGTMSETELDLTTIIGTLTLEGPAFQVCPCIVRLRSVSQSAPAIYAHLHTNLKRPWCA